MEWPRGGGFLNTAENAGINDTAAVLLGSSEKVEKAEKLSYTGRC